MSWQIDQSHSLIQFSVKHMMIAKVRGFFEEFNGSINLESKVKTLKLSLFCFATFCASFRKL